MKNLTKKFWNYLPEFVYGSIDGTVTTFAIIAGIAGANLDPAIVLILGFSNVLADGFSMASSNFLSEESHQAQNGDSESHVSPWKTAIATFVSFIVVGSVPLISYVLDFFSPGIVGDQFRTASILTLVTFFGIGLIRGRVAHASSLKTALQTCLIGVIAAFVAYGVGALLKDII